MKIALIFLLLIWVSLLSFTGIFFKKITEPTNSKIEYKKNK